MFFSDFHGRKVEIYEAKVSFKYNMTDFKRELRCFVKNLITSFTLIWFCHRCQGYSLLMMDFLFSQTFQLYVAIFLHWLYWIFQQKWKTKIKARLKSRCKKIRRYRGSFTRRKLVSTPSKSSEM